MANITHRLSTIRNADVVLMLKDGLIVERGTHDDLLALRGAYYTMYMSQFQEADAEADGRVTRAASADALPAGD